MSEVKNLALERAVKLLEALRCSYAIVTDDGQTFTNGLEVVVPKERRRSPLKYSYGEITAHYKPKLNLNAPVGSVQIIACGRFLPAEIRGGVCSLLSREWGKDTYMSNITPEGVEILRVS